MEYLRFHNFIQSKGFKLVASEPSGPFGNYYYDYDNTTIFFRIVKDRDFMSIDVASTTDRNELYDMTIIMIYMLNEENLLTTYEFDYIIDFFISNYDAIMVLFSAEQYPKTKSLLKNMKHCRAKLIFPGW